MQRITSFFINNSFVCPTSLLLASVGSWKKVNKKRKHYSKIISYYCLLGKVANKEKKIQFKGESLLVLGRIFEIFRS